MNDQENTTSSESDLGDPESKNAVRSNGVHEGADLELARAIRDLDMEIVPERDLWNGVERKIMDYPQGVGSKKQFNWMPYGVAASLVVAVLSLTVSLGSLDLASMGKGSLVSSDTSINRMAVEHVRVMNPLVTQFNQVNENLAPETLDDIYRNLEIMSAARRDIEARVRQDPDDHRLVEMLMNIHEQELDLLRQDFTPSGRF